MDFNQLVQAVQSLNAEDAFRPRLDAGQWQTLSQYLTRHDVRPGDLIIKQGDRGDRAMYLLAIAIYLAVWGAAIYPFLAFGLRHLIS